MVSAAAFCAGVMAMGGCGLFGFVPSPELEVLGARVESTSGEGQRVVFRVNGMNPGGSELPIDRVSYRVLRGERLLFESVRVGEAVLPAGGDQVFEVPASWPIERSVSPGESLEIRGRATYLVPGAFAELLFDTRVRRPRVRFAGEVVLE